MAAVAQLVEHWIVAPGVVGSIPIRRPTLLLENQPVTIPTTLSAEGIVLRGSGQEKDKIRTILIDLIVIPNPDAQLSSAQQAVLGYTN